MPCSLTEFTEHQRTVFCVFSGNGVSSLRRHLNSDPAFASIRDQTPTGQSRHNNLLNFGNDAVQPQGELGGLDNGFDERERDAIEDDDGLDDGSEMVIDALPPGPHANHQESQGRASASLDATIPPPPPPPTRPQGPTNGFQWNPQIQQWYPDQTHPHSAPVPGTLFSGLSISGIPHHQLATPMDPTSMQATASSAPMSPNSGAGSSIAPVGPSVHSTLISSQPIQPTQTGDSQARSTSSRSSPGSI